MPAPRTSAPLSPPQSAELARSAARCFCCSAEKLSAKRRPFFPRKSSAVEASEAEISANSPAVLALFSRWFDCAMKKPVPMPLIPVPMRLIRIPHHRRFASVDRIIIQNNLSKVKCYNHHAQSLLRHPGPSQAGEISGFVQGADLRHPEISSSFQAGDARITVIAGEQPGFRLYRSGETDCRHAIGPHEPILCADHHALQVSLGDDSKQVLAKSALSPRRPIRHQLGFRLACFGDNDFLASGGAIHQL